MSMRKAANLMVSIDRVFLRLPLIASCFADWKVLAQAVISSGYIEDVDRIIAETALKDALERTSGFIEMLQFLQDVRSTYKRNFERQLVVAEAICKYYHECSDSLDVMDGLSIRKKLPPEINRVYYSEEFDSLRTGLYMVSGRIVELTVDANKWKWEQA